MALTEATADRLVAGAASDTATRLGAPPGVETVGWWSWAEEAASLLCARRARDRQHARDLGHPPCRTCRSQMRALLSTGRVTVVTLYDPETGTYSGPTIGGILGGRA